MADEDVQRRNGADGERTPGRRCIPPPLHEAQPHAAEEKRVHVAEAAIEDRVMKQVRAPGDADQRGEHDAVAELAPEQPPENRQAEKEVRDRGEPGAMLVVERKAVTRQIRPYAE